MDAKPEDSDREFVIMFYMNDETVQIHEPPCRNSGVLGGKFLRRDKWKNSAGELLSPKDCQIGGQIVINGYNFAVTGADEATIKWVENNL